MNQPLNTPQEGQRTAESGRKCRKCGYNLTGLPEPMRCPECGTSSDAIFPCTPGTGRLIGGAIVMAILVAIAFATVYVTVALSPDYGRPHSPSTNPLLDFKPGAMPFLGLIFIQVPLSVLAILVASLGAKLTRRWLPFAIVAGLAIAATLINVVLAASAGLL